jgi:RimJ/RimL family protein N-acetyltransferase
MKVYIRPLEENDANTSYKWRNNPRVWEMTGSKPDMVITPEIERDWIRGVLKRADQKRYAICVGETGEYIGNVHFTDVTQTKAQIHCFIGLPEYWSKGIASLALSLLIDVGFNQLGLEEIYGYINDQNIGSLKAAEKVGLKQVSKEDNIVFVRIVNEK